MQRPAVSDSTSDWKFGKQRRRRFKNRGALSFKSKSLARPQKKGRQTIQATGTDASEDENASSPADFDDTRREEESDEASECTEEASFQLPPGFRVAAEAPDEVALQVVKHNVGVDALVGKTIYVQAARSWVVCTNNYWPQPR